MIAFSNYTFAAFIITKDRPDILYSTIHKLMSQSLPPSFVLVIDNGSLVLTSEIIKQLNDMGYHIFVMTDTPEHYTQNELLTVIEYTKPYFSFHEKRVVMRECLKHYDTAVFLDADVFIQEVDNLDFLSDINPGLHIFATFGNIGLTYCSDDISVCEVQGRRNTKYGKEGVDFAEKNGCQDVTQIAIQFVPNAKRFMTDFRVATSRPTRSE